MKYSFSQITVLDLEGREVKGHDIHKVLANVMYAQAKDLDLVETARAIFKGEDVELDKSEIESVKELVNSEQAGIAAFGKKAILDYIESVKESK